MGSVEFCSNPGGDILEYNFRFDLLHVCFCRELHSDIPKNRARKSAGLDDDKQSLQRGA